MRLLRQTVSRRNYSKGPTRGHTRNAPWVGLSDLAKLIIEARNPRHIIVGPENKLERLLSRQYHSPKRAEMSDEEMKRRAHHRLVTMGLIPAEDTEE